MSKVYGIFIFFILGSSCSLGNNENDDNKIYVVGKKFVFDVTFISPDSFTTRTDMLELLVTDDFYPAKIQTAITWSQYKVEGVDTTIIKNATGVEESARRFWIHPPRVGDMEILSFANFPSISKSTLKLDEEQRAKTSIESGGRTAIIRTYKGINVNGVETKSKYMGMEMIDLPMASRLNCDKIYTEGKSAVGNIIGIYHFNKKYGFVQFNYKLPDGSKIILRLRNAGGTGESQSE